MYRTMLIWGLWIVLLFIGAGSALGDQQGDAIAAALQNAPPAVPMTDARQKALMELDDFIGRPMSERLEPVIAYYRAAVDRALDKLEKEKVTSGVRIFQLYSSSVIVQTPETIFAFDLDQGPNERMDSTPAQEGVRFCMTEKQVARVAALVNYSFHTHAHGDHIDFQLSKALLDAGKTVVVTEECKAMWEQMAKGEFPGAQKGAARGRRLPMWEKMKPEERVAMADKLTVLDQTVKTPNQLGPLKVDVLRDRQWGKALHTSGMQCDAFVVTLPDGVTVMTKGDINCGLQLYGWLSLLKLRGVKLDAVAGSVLFWKGVDILPEWDALFKPLWLPGHTWEFGHRGKDQPKGNCAAYEDIWRYVHGVTHSEKVQSLSWGEWIDVGGKP
jgi:hypothetical protein